MSQVHVISCGQTCDTLRVVMHFAVPASPNAAGVSMREALVDSHLGGSTVLNNGEHPGRISDDEQTAIRAGCIYEKVVEVAVSGTPEEQQEQLRVAYGQERQATMDYLAVWLNWSGLELEEE